MQYVAKDMVERGEGGAVVNVSSLSSLCALKEHAVYCKLMNAVRNESTKVHNARHTQALQELTDNNTCQHNYLERLDNIKST